MNNGLSILTTGVITGNLILLQGLGMYALTRHTKNVKQSLHAGGAMIGAMATAAIGVWILQLLAIPVALESGAILVVAALAAFLWQRLLGRSVSLVDGLLDSALVGLLLLMVNDGIVGVTMVGLALSAGIGYMLVLVVMATIRQRLEAAPIPKALQGVPITLITAGLLAIVLLGFRL